MSEKRLPTADEVRGILKSNSPPAVQASEDEWLTARRWIGDGMSPGSWSTDLAIFNRDDGSEYEEATFVPDQRLREVEAERDQARRHAYDRDVLDEALNNTADEWRQAEERLREVEVRLAAYEKGPVIYGSEAKKAAAADAALADLQAQHRELADAVLELPGAKELKRAQQLARKARGALARSALSTPSEESE